MTRILTALAALVLVVGLAQAPASAQYIPELPTTTEPVSTTLPDLTGGIPPRPTPKPDGTLPRTGSDWERWALLGAFLLAGGGLVLLATRKRHATT